MAEIKSCPCAPLFCPCVFEKQESLGCATRRLNYALTEFLRAIPILCPFVEPFKCDLFEFGEKQEGT